MVQTGRLSRKNGIPSLISQPLELVQDIYELFELPPKKLVTSPALRESEWPSGNSGGTTVEKNINRPFFTGTIDVFLY
ncbi:hypothetical protein HDC33_000812 [Sporosarcina sp. JAI121]|nr:hypothetical protein [Sporosarcina sp. JAI121]